MRSWRERGRAEKIALGFVFGIGGLAFAAGLALLFGWVLMMLWNWLMPTIFGLPEISYWQGWGLILLSHLLFKGGGGHGGGHGGHGGHGGKCGSKKHKHHHGHGRCGGPGDSEEFNDFKRQFKRRMRERWGEEDFSEKEPEPADEAEKTEADKE